MQLSFEKLLPWPWLAFLRRPVEVVLGTAKLRINNTATLDPTCARSKRVGRRLCRRHHRCGRVQLRERTKDPAYLLARSKLHLEAQQQG